MLKVIVTDQNENQEIAQQSIAEIARLGAQKLLAKALQEEVNDYLHGTTHLADNRGNRLIVRNGYARERTVLTGAGEIGLRAPRINDRREGKKFTSNILPPYMRKCPKR